MYFHGTSCNASSAIYTFMSPFFFSLLRLAKVFSVFYLFKKSNLSFIDFICLSNLYFIYFSYNLYYFLLSANVELLTLFSNSLRYKFKLLI